MSGERVQIERLHSLARISCIRHQPGLFSDAVLCDPVDEVHVRPDQLAVIAQPVYGVGAVVDEEFQVQVGDVAAGPAGAGGVHFHQCQRAPESGVRPFDLVQQCLALIETALGGMADDGVALKPGDAQGQVCFLDQQLDQVVQHLPGVVELRFVQIDGVTRDVCDQKKTLHGFSP